MDPHESAPNGISIGSAVFIQHIRVTNKHTQTERQRDEQTDRQTDRQTNNVRHL